MNRARPLLLSLAAILTCGLVSCNSSGGSTINNPTVEDMTKLEGQWGLKPRSNQSRGIIPAENTASAPVQSRQPDPEPVPLPAAPGVAQDAPANVDASTIQKLR